MPPASLGAVAAETRQAGSCPIPEATPLGWGQEGLGQPDPCQGVPAMGTGWDPPSDHVPAQYTLLFPHAWVPSWELQSPPNWVPVTGIFWGSGSYFRPFPGPADEAVPGGTGCFLGNHRAAKVKLPGQVVSATPVIFGTAVIAMAKSGAAVAETAGRREGWRDGR